MRRGIPPPLLFASCRFVSANAGANLLTDFIDERVAAKLLGKSPGTLRHWRVDRANLPFHKIGRSVRYRRIDVLAFIQRSRVECTAQERSS